MGAVKTAGRSSDPDDSGVGQHGEAHRRSRHTPPQIDLILTVGLEAMANGFEGVSSFARLIAHSVAMAV